MRNERRWERRCRYRLVRRINCCLLILSIGISGCAKTSRMKPGSVGDGDRAAKSVLEAREEADPVIEIACELFKSADEEGRMDDLEIFRSIVKRFGDNGYAAVDGRNQIDMTEPDQVTGFCKKVDAKEEGKLTIIKLNDVEGALDGIVKYDLQTGDGEVEVTTSYYKYIKEESRNSAFSETGEPRPAGDQDMNQKMDKVFSASFPAELWQYTQDGYLMFSGSYYSEQLYALTMSEGREYAAFRVLPLDEKCRELNRQYILPVSYERNNLFLTDWNEEDFGDLDFYDLYDLFYHRINGRQVPYGMEENSGDAVYRIPKDEFESVISRYINIDSGTLRTKTVFYPEDGTYAYRPRGFSEAEYPEYPYPEVVRYTENDDGTITLTVNVIYPYKGIPRVYAHEVVIRPLEDGGGQYVSNRIIPSGDNREASWHKPRLTLEEWEEIRS